MRLKIRNNITGAIFGKYNLDEQVTEYLVNDEEYISGLEIIEYNENLYLLSIIFAILSIGMSILYTPLFLLLILISLYLIFISTELELVYLTSERLIIEKRTFVEKILKTNNVKSISVDQIAVVSFARAPFQLPSIIIGSVIIASVTLDILFDIIGLNTILAVFVLTLSLYLFWFGLRLAKRSIEISVIGVVESIGIGRKKGAPIWFLDELHQIIFERVHHTFHSGSEADSIDSSLQEFPLEYSGIVKELIKRINRPIQKKILQLLDESNLTKKVLESKLPKYSKVEIGEGMRQLRRKRYVFYNRSMNVWCLNREYIIESKTMD